MRVDLQTVDGFYARIACLSGADQRVFAIRDTSSSVRSGELAQVESHFTPNTLP
jgi:hypothetical protein